MLRLLLWILAGAILAAGAFTGWVWIASEAHLRSFPEPAAFSRTIPTDPATRARGAELVFTRGCTGCHGDRMQGEVFHEGPWGERAVAPSLTALSRKVGPAVFERAIRHGIGHDGRALFSMPSYNFVRLSDDDVVAIIAYIQSAPDTERKLPTGSLGWKIRFDLARGADAAIPAFLDRVPPLRWQGDPDPAVRRGEYLAMTSCNECHGFGLAGDDPWAQEGERAPDLTIVGAYEKADFVRLMRAGKAPGDRELRLMSKVARWRFSHWTEAEVDDLYAFLQARAKKVTGG